MVHLVLRNHTPSLLMGIDSGSLDGWIRENDESPGCKWTTAKYRWPRF
jgi:hypothetical protein